MAQILEKPERMPETWQELRQAVDSNGGVKTYPMWVLRDIAGFGRLGPHVRTAIKKELIKVALVPQGSGRDELPEYQDDQVRIFAMGGPIAELIMASRTPGEHQDAMLRQAAGGGSDSEEVLLRIKELVCGQAG